MKLHLVSGRLTVCQLPAGAPFPAHHAVPAGLFALIRTEDELTLVCAESFVPPSVRQETGWRALKVEGPLDFGLTGILVSLCDPLARAGISVFSVSTYNTDYILVKEARLAEAVQALQAAGHKVRDY